MDSQSLPRAGEPDDLVAALAATRIEQRDAATRLLIAMGPEVAQRVLRWGDAPPSNRARRLWTYTGIHLRRAEVALRRTLAAPIEHAGTLASALDAIAAQRGVLVATDLPAEAQRPVSLALDDATLLSAADEAAAQAGCRIVQHARGELAVEAMPEPRYPAAYSGPMRIRVVELQTTRTSDFVATRTSTTARLRIDWEWPVSPLGSVAVQLADSSRVYEVAPVAAVVSVGTIAEVVVELPTRPRLAIAGDVHAEHDGEQQEVTLRVPGTTTAHGITVAAQLQDGCHLVVETQDPVRVTATGLHGLSPMILAIATTGEEGIPQVHRVRTTGSGAITERWGLRFREGFGAVAELRLRISAPPSRATLPFVLPAIELP
ncbi:MAG TPA: hypothetical protein VFQ53_05810 [Kofleriaceae bacterium]|nr:hypothetical protein [Kofleriaceae bacterium]